MREYTERGKNLNGYTLFKDSRGCYQLCNTRYPFVGVFHRDWGEGCDDFFDRRKSLKAARNYCKLIGADLIASV